MGNLAIGSRVGYRLGGSRVNPGSLSLRSRRKRTFLLGDASGRVFYSVDGRSWKFSSTLVGGAGTAQMGVNNGRVLINEGTNTLSARLSTDGLRSWEGAQFDPTGAGSSMSNVGFFNDGAAMSLDGDAPSGTLPLNCFRHFADEYGVTRVAYGSAGGPLYYPSVDTPILAGAASYGGGTGRHGAYLNEVCYQTDSGSGPVVITPISGNTGPVTVSSLVTSPGAAWGCATDGITVIAVGGAGSFARLVNPPGFNASDWVTGTVGFTANDLNVVLWNGEVFLCAGQTGVVGISYDRGVTWVSSPTGFATTILSGCTSYGQFG